MLALSTYPADDASLRLRFLAYVPALEAAGWEVRLHSIVSPRLFAAKNRRGVRVRLLQAALLAKGLIGRIIVIATCRRYDAIWIHREAFPFFTPWAERSIRYLTRGRVVLDFDDALYAAPPGGTDWRSRLRDPRRYRDAVLCADEILAGSPVLASWAEQQGSKVRFVPTCFEHIGPGSGSTSSSATVTIGWIGSWSTAPSLSLIVDPLRSLARQQNVRVLLVGASNLRGVAELIPGAEWRTWSISTEHQDLSEFDIGLMPVEDSVWNQGKCAFKLVQYMSRGIPFVASPVGMNVAVTQESNAGILCTTSSEWLWALNLLVSDQCRRQAMGADGHRYWLSHFDSRLQVPVVLAALSGDESPT